jgi:hypothetical protein
MPDTETTWETDEVDRWLSNDEGMYYIARRACCAEDLRQNFEGQVPGIDDWSEVDWDYIFEQFEEDRDG